MNNKKVVIIASECQPFFASGGLGDVIGSLPKPLSKALNDKLLPEEKNEVIVVLPLYSRFLGNLRNKLVYVKQLTVTLAWRKQYCGIFKYSDKDVTYYFLDNEYYFKRHNYYGYFDDAERFAFFSKAAIETMLALEITPDIIHAHDWQTGLVPIYMRTLYYNDLHFINTKRIFTIHNIEYQGKYSNDQDILEDVFGLDLNDRHLLEYNGSLNIMKGAMDTANLVSTVSPTYAKEIVLPQYAHQLEHEVNRVLKENKLRGILNGIDKNFYNPSKDDALFEKFDAKSFVKKRDNKKQLQEMLNLPVDENIPLISMVTRLVKHKGLDLVKQVLESIMNERVQLVILGTGDPTYEGFLKDMEARYHSKLRVIIAFNQDLSRKIYGASDLFLMPSLSEPCGLSQMIASRYGAIPIVRRTGGLADSICDFTINGGNGYTFDNCDSNEMLNVIRRALFDYSDQEEWAKKVSRVMNVDFGWSRSAKEYVKMYEELL